MQNIPINETVQRIASGFPGYLEFRYHNRTMRSLGVRKGELNENSYKQIQGAGIRVLQNGAWGFASTSDLTEIGLQSAVKKASAMAQSMSGRKKNRVNLAGTNRLATGEFNLDGYFDLKSMDLEQKFHTVQTSEENLRKANSSIETAVCQYTEVFEEKYIFTTDGADCWVRLVRPELRFVAYAADGSRLSRGYDSVGATGGWNCLFQNRPLEDYIETAARNASDLLAAGPASGGRKKVILSPAMVGLLSHEAIGHTVEADFVQAGSVAQGKLGEMVASELVTLCDSGASEYAPNAGGELPVDDEGVMTGKTEVIKDGRLVSYLHNRESAQNFETQPTGNARAWEFSDEPLIRMRNTYIAPGKDNLQEMIAGIEDGYFIDGPEGGQADATAEFMFGASRVRRIKDGKLGETVQKVTVSGNAFDVLQSIDAVSSDFRWDLGSGHCGKGQPAKVDAGGPYLRCELLVGGAQN
ncbi:MAG: Zn-dependent protease [Spirochaetaceae bacterium]|nr:Zn-dependent protease [Spirochaetaceae bacterium]|tara:strand:+ start:46689 stop:48095 length:1407 start_codon:yes stop_codon:yes gene_type:complete